MGRMGRLLAGLALGGMLVFSPASPAVLDAPAAQAQSSVQAQASAPALELPAQAPPGPDLTGDDQQSQGKQRIVKGLCGVALIALVLLSRKARKKPVFAFKWKS